MTAMSVGASLSGISCSLIVDIPVGPYTIQILSNRPSNLESRSRYQTSTRRLVLVSRGARARGGEQTSIGTLRPAVSSACRKFSERTQLHRAGVNHRDRR